MNLVIQTKADANRNFQIAGSLFPKDGPYFIANQNRYPGG